MYNNGSLYINTVILKEKVSKNDVFAKINYTIFQIREPLQHACPFVAKYVFKRLVNTDAKALLKRSRRSHCGNMDLWLKDNHAWSAPGISSVTCTIQNGHSWHHIQPVRSTRSPPQLCWRCTVVSPWERQTSYRWICAGRAEQTWQLVYWI